jgi:diguanylate cyclase (GGDEF)-like protein
MQLHFSERSQLLRQFAAELKSAFRAADEVGRWGGDEFIVVMDGGEKESAARLERVQSWVFGDYTLKGEQDPGGCGYGRGGLAAGRFSA